MNTYHVNSEREEALLKALIRCQKDNGILERENKRLSDGWNYQMKLSTKEWGYEQLVSILKILEKADLCAVNNKLEWANIISEARVAIDKTLNECIK